MKYLTQLWLKDPHCYWCGITTYLFHRTPRPKNMPRKLYHQRMASRDHLYSNFSPFQHDDRQHSSILPLVVLACQRCNHYRGGFESKYCTDHHFTKPWICKTTMKQDPVERLIGIIKATTDFSIWLKPQNLPTIIPTT